MFDCDSAVCDILSCRLMGSGGLIVFAAVLGRDCLRAGVFGVGRMPLYCYVEDGMREVKFDMN